MHITLDGGHGKCLRLHFPSGLVLNRVSAILLSAVLKDKSLNISSGQLSLLFQAIKTYKATHPEWKMIEVHNHDGENIVIVI